MSFSYADAELCPRITRVVLDLKDFKGVLSPTVYTQRLVEAGNKELVDRVAKADSRKRARDVGAPSPAPKRVASHASLTSLETTLSEYAVGVSGLMSLQKTSE